MRDMVLDRLVQPTVNRRGTDTRRAALNAASLYAALSIVSASYTLSASRDLVGTGVGIVFSMLMAGMLVAGAANGPSTLQSPFALPHLCMRLLFLGLGVIGLIQTWILTSMGIVPPPARLMADLSSSAASLAMSASMYLAICEAPARRRH